MLSLGKMHAKTYFTAARGDVRSFFLTAMRELIGCTRESAYVGLGFLYMWFNYKFIIMDRKYFKLFSAAALALLSACSGGVKNSECAAAQSDSLSAKCGFKVEPVRGVAEQPQTVLVKIKTTDGKVETREVALAPQPDGSQRLFLASDSFPEKLVGFDIIHPRFLAQKGESGFWLFPRGEYGEFDCDNGEFIYRQLIMPFYGVQTPRGTYIGIAKTFRFGFFTRVGAKDGKYSLVLGSKLWKAEGVKPYEDVIVDFYRLEGDDADYSGIARFYRNYQFSRGACRTLKARFGERPNLEYQTQSFPVRIQYHAAKKPPQKGAKKEHYTVADEPPLKVYLSFADATKFVRAIRDAGVDKVTFCSAGWQSGGYDGRFPDIFPIDEEIGGEEGLKKFIKDVRDMGYLISAHTNSTDCYSCSRMWTEDMVCTFPDGSFAKNGIWCGGRAYNLCLKYAWDNFLPKQLDDMKRLGFTEPHYIDVFTAVNPYACYNPRHKINAKQAAEYQDMIAQKCVENFGGFSSECGYDHIIDKIDYCNYVGRRFVAEKNPLVKRVLPVWEIVYHGIVLSNPDRYTQQNITDNKDKILRLMEFGGRPIIYTNRLSDVPVIAKLYELYKPVRHLQTELIHSHRQAAKDVYITTYENGAEMVCNYSQTPFNYKGQTVEPKGYKLF